MQEMPSLHLYSDTVSKKKKKERVKSNPGVVTQQFSKGMAENKLKANKTQVATAVSLKSGRPVVPILHIKPRD